MIRGGVGWGVDGSRSDINPSKHLMCGQPGRHKQLDKMHFLHSGEGA